MQVDYPMSKDQATPDYVLSVLQDLHRQTSQVDPEVDPYAALSFNTTVAEWRLACDLLPWRELGRTFNGFFDVNCSDDEWRAALEPSRNKTLRDVCEFIAVRCLRPQIRPAFLLGPPCATAGAFLTIRSLLRENGADVSGITPSAELSPYSRRYWRVFVEKMARLTPGALPAVRVRTPVYDCLVAGLLLAMICFAIGAITQAPYLILGSFLGGLAFYAGIWIATRYVLPSSVAFGDLRTFRDLAEAISKNSDDIVAAPHR